jgi:hypothetical protein
MANIDPQVAQENRGWAYSLALESEQKYGC